MIARLPGGAVLCLDEAYADFAPEGALPPLDPDEPRVIRMRTFSKAHGMAGARIGYAIGHPELIAAFDRVRNHFGVNRLARRRRAGVAGRSGLARAGGGRGRGGAAADRRDRRGERAARRWRRRRISWRSIAAATAPSRGGCWTALVARGVFVRKPFVAPQDRCIRVSAGREAELAAFAAALPEALAAAG